MISYYSPRIVLPVMLLIAVASCMAGGFEITEVMPDDGSVQWTLTGSVRILNDRSCYPASITNSLLQRCI